MEADSFLPGVFDSVQVLPLIVGIVVTLVITMLLFGFSGYRSASEIVFFIRRFLCFFLFIFSYSCSGNYSPKPSGYFRLELEQPVYRQFKASSAVFSFNIQQQANIEVVVDATESNDWFDVDYPFLNAKIHCSLFPIRSGNDLIAASEQSRKLAYIHVVKADGISEKSYSDPEHKVYALIYDVDGNVPSPVQFVITDSVHYFFRGALYFNVVPNRDSIAPVKDYIRNDIQEIITSFRWLHE